MKVLLITCAVLCCLFGLAVANEEPSEPPITDEQAACILRILQETDVDAEHVGDMALEIVDSFQRLIAHHQRCEDILSDPPSALEGRLHEACRLSWYALVVAELLRLREMSHAVDFFDELLVELEVCRYK